MPKASISTHGSHFHYINRYQAEVDFGDDGTQEEPINREQNMSDLISSFLTKSENYNRNHGVIQHKLADDHTVVVDGLVENELKLSVENLINDFPQHTVVCALQCAGNRRHTMRTRIKEVDGVDWFDAAIMNVSFTGPRVRDILQAAGVGDENEDTSRHPGEGAAQGQRNHVQFANYGSKTQEDDWYGGSIPFARAMDPDMDVILAIKMNGEPLPARHGFPVRSVVPGVLGARSVKWLDRITVSDEESDCFYQKHDYKILPPEATDKGLAEKYWDTTPAMLEMPVNACVAVPASQSKIKLSDDGLVDVSGYAVPHGSDGPVVHVEVSGDEGKTWIEAQIDDGGELASKWSWVLWNAKVKMEPGKGRKIFAKATDAGGNTQGKERSTWNLRGVAYNGYECVFDLTVM